MNYIGLIAIPTFVAAVAYTVVGMIWYSPFLFAKPWAKLALGQDKASQDMKKGMAMTYLGAFIAAIITACILRKLLIALDVTTAVDGARYGLWFGIGFFAAPLLTDFLFTKKSAKLYGITAGYHLVAWVVIGALLASWK